MKVFFKELLIASRSQLGEQPRANQLWQRQRMLFRLGSLTLET
jgi:hypothetical protein